LELSGDVGTTVVTTADIVSGLRGLGVEPGDRLMVHSSLKSLGRVDGGPLTVIAALQEAVGPGGTVMMPSFNHGAIYGESGAGILDPKTTPTCNGMIPDTFWRLPRVFRSLHPTHSFACWGRDAERYTRFHHRTLTMGPDSPIGLLARDGGYGLLIGVGYEANSAHHVAEFTMNAPCLGFRTCEYPMLLRDGRRVKGRAWGWRAGVCPVTDRTRYAAEMVRRGLERVTKIGNARVTRFCLQDCVEVVCEMLRKGGEGFPPCCDCAIRPNPRYLTVPSDWDREKGCLLPESEAWGY
jgi:aminoglycoside 3-N-acetyltransferase